MSGHLVDAPDRPQARFPSSRIEWVTNQIRQAFAEWRVGPGTTVISGGARGADIIAAEQARIRGARIVLCLALPPDEFERRSVALPGSDWTNRFRRLLEVAEVRRLTAEIGEVPGDDRVFLKANAWMVDLARHHDPQPYALIVWDGKTGDGPGGTADLVRRLGYAGNDPRLCVIDPTPPGIECT